MKLYPVDAWWKRDKKKEKKEKGEIFLKNVDVTIFKSCTPTRTRRDKELCDWRYLVIYIKLENFNNKFERYFDKSDKLANMENLYVT